MAGTNDKKAWLDAVKKKQQPRSQAIRSNMKGIGPNKASGHKGGISRQGSKRG